MGETQDDTSPEVCQTWLLWVCQLGKLTAPFLGKGSTGKWCRDGARMCKNMWLEMCQEAIMVKGGLFPLFLIGYQPKATYTQAGYRLCSSRDLAALWWMSSCCPATHKLPLNQAASAQKHSIATFKSNKAIKYFGRYVLKTKRKCA